MSLCASLSACGRRSAGRTSRRQPSPSTAHLSKQCVSSRTTSACGCPSARECSGGIHVGRTNSLEGLPQPEDIMVGARKPRCEDEGSAPLSLTKHGVGLRNLGLGKVGAEPPTRRGHSEWHAGSPPAKKPGQNSVGAQRHGPATPGRPQASHLMRPLWPRRGAGRDTQDDWQCENLSGGSQERNAWWLKAVRYAHAITAGGRPVRLRRGRRILVKRRWDAPIQQTPDKMVELDRCEATPDRDVWTALEPRFVQGVLRRASPGANLPRHRHCIQPAAEDN